MSETFSAMDALRAPDGAAVANGLDAAAARDELAANNETRAELRHTADKAEFRLAIHDLAEGLRGIVRVAPLAAIGTAVVLGLMWGRRRRPLPPRRA